jgi:hypothetical protein
MADSTVVVDRHESAATHRRGVGDALVDAAHRDGKLGARVQLDSEVARVGHADASLQQYQSR